MPDPIDTQTPLDITGPPPKPPAPKGSHQFVCVFAEDMGETVQRYENNPPKIVRKIVLGFEYKAKMDDGRPWMISREFTASLGAKSNLGPFLENWRGREFTNAEREKFNIRSLIGVNGIASVIHKAKAKGPGFRAVVVSIAPLMDGMETIKPYNTTLPDWLSERKAKYAKELGDYLSGQASGPEPFEGSDPAADSVPF